jgi:hypothetical protein
MITAGVWLATPAWAGPFFFFTGNTDGRSYAKHGLPRSKALSRYLIWRQRFGTKGIAGLRNRIAMVKNAA